MRKIWVLNFISVLLLLVGGGCYTATEPDPVLLGKKYFPENHDTTDRILASLDILRLDDARMIAAENNQNYLATLQYVNAAKLRYYQSLGAYAPEVHLNADVGQVLSWGSDMINPPSNLAGRETAFQFSSGVTASWLLFDGFARYLTTQIRKHEYERELAVRMRVQCMVKRAVEYAYYDLQYAREIERIQQHDIEFQNSLYQLVKKEHAAKLRLEDEVLNFLILAGVGRDIRIVAINQAEISGYALAQLMGYSAGRLPKKLQVEPIRRELRKMYYSVDLCMDIALENSPDMHIMRQLLEVARLTKYRSYSAFFPVLNAYFKYGNMRYDANYRNYMKSHRSFTQNGISYGISADYLIFNGFRRYNSMREAQAQYIGAEYNLSESYLTIINAIQSAYSTYETSYQQYEIFRDLLSASRRQRDLVLARYLKRHVSVDRMDKTQKYYVDIQTRYAASVTQFLKAIAQLEAIMMINIYEKQ